MDYGQLIGRAWKIVWNHKWLLAFSLLVTVGRSVAQVLRAAGSAATSLDDTSLLAPLCCLLLPVAVALRVAGMIAGGAMIAGVDQIEATGECRFADAWRAAWQKGWRLVGILLVTGLLAIVFVMVLSGAIMVTAGAMQFFAREMEDLAISGLSALTVTLACVGVFGWFAIGGLLIFANRACMLEDTNVFGSYGRSWEVLRRNLGQVIVLFLIQGAISMAVLILLSLLLVLIFALLQFQYTLMEFSSYLLLLFLFVLLVDAAGRAFFSAQWTLAWRQWADSGPMPEIVEQEPAV